MKILLLIFVVLIVACAGPTKNVKKIKVRLTTYSKNEKHSDRWTRREQSSTGVKLKDRAVLAANPADIPYFSKVKLPCFDYLLPVIDTGKALVTRKAALAWGQNVPVLDLYFAKESDATKFREENPMFLDVLVYNK